MDPSSYKVVFLKLSEAASRFQHAEASPSESEEIAAELEEIAELKKFFLEVTAPEPKSFTVT